jgi:peptide/nickel transport system substrate-binding protein
VNPNDYDRNKLRDGFSVDGSGPYTVKIDSTDDTVTKAVFTKNSRYKG